jgi:ureidoacrylate peracid hydrolase
MQNSFVQGYPSLAPDGLAVLDRINRLAAACRDAGILVIHTSHVLRPDGSNVGVLGEINPGLLVEGVSWSSAIRWSSCRPPVLSRNQR